MKYFDRFFFILIIVLSGELHAQKFYTYTESSQEPLDYVTGVKFINGESVEMARSNFQGELKFKETETFLDSVVFFKMGYESQVVRKDNFKNKIYLKIKSEKLEEVVITGQIIPGNKYQSPFQIKYYTAKEIKNKSAVNLADFLQTENNFNVTQDPILGTKISINGMSGSDLKLLIDNVPVVGRLNGNIDYSQILLSDIDRIEVVNAPLSTIYGTNATGGVINLITKTGSINETRLIGSIYGETVGLINGNLHFNSTKNGHKINLGFQRNVFFGWDQYADSLKEVIKPIWREKAWKPKEQLMVNASYYAPVSKKSNLHFKINSFWESIINKLNPTSQYQNIVYDEVYNTNRINVGANSNTILTKFIEWQNYSNFNLYKRDVENYSQNLREGTKTKLNSNSEDIINLFYRSQFKYEFSKKIKMLFGTDFDIDFGNSIKLNDNIKPLWDYGIFFMSSIHFNEKIMMQPGLRFSVNNVSNNPMSGTINFRYNPIEILSTRLSLSRGYRIPDIKELYFDFVDVNHNIKGNEDLRSELNDNIQLGLDVKPSKKHKNPDNLLSYSTSFNFNFYHKKNAIELVNINPSLNEFQYRNIGNSIGLIYSLDNRIKYSNFLFVLGTTVNSFSRKVRNSINQIPDFLYNVTANCNFTYEFKGAGTRITFLNKLYGGHKFLVYNTQENSVSTSKMPFYYIMDLNIAQPVFKKKFNIVVGSKNILDYKNLRVVGFSGNFHSNGEDGVNNLWGRTFFMRIDMDLNLRKE